MRGRILAAACVLLGATACGTPGLALNALPAAVVAAKQATIPFDGLVRTYLLWRPAGLSLAKPVPLVIAMHGYTSSAVQLESMSNLDGVANRYGFVVVYPAGLGRSWDAGWCCNRNTGDDVGFISALIDRLVPEQNIDRTRILATGMSNGAMMAQRLACELGSKITSAVSVSGSLLVAGCRPSRPISVLEIHGVADVVVPINGGFHAGLGTFRSTMSVMRQWAGIDGCPAVPAIADDAITTTYTWAPCREGTRVVLEAVKRGGHSWFVDASADAWHFLMSAPPVAS